MQKYLPIISILLLGVTSVLFVLYPVIASTLGIISLLITLTLSTHTIIHKHAGIEHARFKILKEAGVMVLTLIIAIFLGGIAAMLVNAQVGMRWGGVAGLVSAIGVSFMAGYLVRKGMMKLSD